MNVQMKRGNDGTILGDIYVVLSRLRNLASLRSTVAKLLCFMYCGL